MQLIAKKFNTTHTLYLFKFKPVVVWDVNFYFGAKQDLSLLLLSTFLRCFFVRIQNFLTWFQCEKLLYLTATMTPLSVFRVTYTLSIVLTVYSNAIPNYNSMYFAVFKQKQEFAAVNFVEAEDKVTQHNGEIPDEVSNMSDFNFKRETFLQHRHKVRHDGQKNGQTSFNVWI